MSAVLTIEGPVGFGCQPEMLDDLYRIGFRITYFRHIHIQCFLYSGGAFENGIIHGIAGGFLCKEIICIFLPI